MTVHFKPTRADGRSYRDVAVDALKDKSAGDVITYRAIAGVLNLNPIAQLHQIQSAVRSANKILCKLHKRAVHNVRNVGYRILPARENMLVANSHQTKADTQMKIAIMFFEGANLEEMTESERRLHQGQAMLAHQLAALYSYQKTKFDRLEALFKGPVVNQK